MNQDSAQKTDKYEELVAKCRARIHQTLGAELPSLAVVLGSGFQALLEGFRVLGEVGYSALPGFPQPGVAGHAGKLLLGELGGMGWLVCSGRAHFYEGHSMEAVMFPVRVLGACGVRDLVLTNAAGGINAAYRSGDFMVFTDHINFLGVNPLRSAEGAPRFVDMSRAYDRGMRNELLKAGRRARVRMQRGVYVGVSGPCYETPAEIRAFRRLGADAVGMSTIPEVLMARSLGMNVAAVSCITNPAAGLRRAELSHEEVLENGRKSARRGLRLLAEFSRWRARSAGAEALEGRDVRKKLKKNGRGVRSPSRKR